MHLRSQSRSLPSLLPNQALLTAAVMAALAAPAPAQSLFAELPRKGLPVAADRTYAMALGDLDGDGDLDMVSGNYNQQNRLYLNDGTGAFTSVTTTNMPVSIDQTLSLVLGDVDGDGDLDMVSGNRGSNVNYGEQNRLLLNDGAGTFTDATSTNMPIDNAYTGSVALGDVDGDGDLDLAVGNIDLYFYPWGGQTLLYLNDGAGAFTNATATRMPGDGDRTNSVAFGDVDGDGDLDMALGNWPQNRLYLNDGTGTFTDATATNLPVDNAHTSVLKLGDVDGDGDLDMVLGNSLQFGEQDRLYLNNGTGTFTDVTATHMPVATGRTFTMALGDVEGDGDLDLVVGGWGPNLLYLNSGTGTFTDATATHMPIATFQTDSMSFGDLDADGDLDLALGAFVQNRLYLNLQRQLCAPVAPQIGQPYTFDIYARYGPSRSMDLALPYVSTALASIPVPPFGILGIDPVEAIPLPWVVIPQPAGVASSSVFVPNDPALIGLSAYGQALLLQPPLQARLTNVTVDVIW